MKRILSLLQPYVIRAIAYSSLSKIGIALIAIFLWNGLINEKSLFPRGVVEYGFFALGIWFLIGAWIQYLSFDGVRPFQFSRRKEKTGSSEKGFRLANLFGFQNRLITAMDEEELDDEEATVAKLFSNLLVALFFLIPCMVVTLL